MRVLANDSIIKTLIVNLQLQNYQNFLYFQDFENSPLEVYKSFITMFQHGEDGFEQQTGRRAIEGHQLQVGAIIHSPHLHSRLSTQLFIFISISLSHHLNIAC